MAYIVSTTQTATASAATYTVTLGAHQSGDLLLVYLSQDGGGTAIAPDATSTTAGWAMIGTQAASGVSRSAWAYLIADSASEVNPVFTGANDDWIGTCLVIRDAHATAPFGTLVSGTDFVRTDWNNVGSTTSGALTTAVDECLLIYSWNSDGNTQYLRAGWTDCVEVDKYATGAINHIIGCRQQQTAAVAPTVTMYNINATEGGNGWILAVRNKTGGALQPDVRVTGSELKFYGPWSATHDSVTWQSPDQFAASINSITCGTTVPTVSASAPWVEEPYGQFTSISSGNSTTGEWAGGTHAISSTNMTGKIFSIQWGQIASSTGTAIGSDGVILGFSDGTNWIAYQIATKAKGWTAATVSRLAIVLGSATAYASSGSINWGAVTRIGYFYHRVGSVTTANGWNIKNAVLVSSVAITGGGSSRPLALQDFDAYINSFSQYRHTRLQSSAQIQTSYPVQIGDGTNKTYFDGAAQSLEFPQGWSATSVRGWQMEWNANASTVSLAVKASASDTIKLAAGVAATDTLQALTIDSASSTSATYDFGQSFVGWTPTWKTGVSCVGSTFSGCGPVNFKGASPTNITVKNTLATSSEAAISFDANGATLTTSTLDVTGTSAGYHISLGASVTSITLNGNTFTGTPGTDKIYSALASGTLTITWDGVGTSIVAGDVTFVGGSTAVAVIAAPTVNQSVTITGLVAGSRVQIYDTTSSTELSNTTPAGTSVTWTDANPAVASRAIRVRITKVSGATAYEMIEANIGTCGTTAGTDDISYLANQTLDTTYNTNAIDGSAVTGITIDDATDRVTINIAGGSVTWPQIYAYQVYWLNTSTGIQDDFAFIEAPDTANYLVTTFKIKNTSSPTAPLVISSGYGRDSTTGASVDLVDTTGGTLIFAPDHVVAYSSGSGLTAGQDANLSAIKSATDAYLDATVSSRLPTASYSAPPSAATIATQVLTSAQSTPIHSDAKKMNGATITGAGTSGDKWRGA